MTCVHRFRFFHTLTVAIGMCVYCQTAATQEDAKTDVTTIELPGILDWKPVADVDQKAIRVAHFKLTKPRPLNIIVAQISISNDLEIIVTPGNGKKKLETTGIKTSTFLNDYQCDIAINAAPFQPVQMLENRQHDVRGLQIADGELVSAATPKTPVLVFDKQRRPRILAQPPKTNRRIQNAIAGFHIVLKQGKPQGDAKTLHPRTAVGIDKKGSQMFLLVVDGRQNGISEGASQRELGMLLGQLGCHDGINLDGGGTTTIVSRTAEGKHDVLNVPIHVGVPGLERPSASHLGFRFRKKKPERRIK